MNLRRPPQLAVWLLKRTGVTAGNEPLAGDLFEEFHHGRTSGWYWRQTGIAILAAFVRGLRISLPDILPWFLGWFAETGAVFIASRLFHVPFGFRFAAIVGIVFAAIALVMYLEVQIRLRFWFKEFELSDEEWGIALRRRIVMRMMALGAFGGYVLADLIALGIGMLIDAASRSAHISVSPTSLADLMLAHVIWIGLHVGRTALKAAGSGPENS